MIQESYISFEQAKALKELGFPQDWEHSPVYSIQGRFIGMLENISESKCKCSAPTQSLVQKWLREEKELHIVPLYESWPNIHYHLQINDDDILYQDSPGYSYPQDFETYEQALSAGIDKCIELLKENERKDSTESN